MGLNASRKAVDDITRAAEYIATNNLRNTTAIAYARAAELYGLQTLAKGIQDDSSNVTRFVILSREPIIHLIDWPFKTSIVFAQKKVPATRAHPSINNPPSQGTSDTG
ncbi:Arogenate dehydratase/prephenate dehydratase 6 [Forsythia ovata]|uniref:Arogenate dehydratase/prephenate dehydratase 6 n=1 Tax=Forsythia ovata TaxID=205694 RepID=A0ABD1W9H5_9LAMI